MITPKQMVAQSHAVQRVVKGKCARAAYKPTVK